MVRKPLPSQPIIFVSFASADVALATEFQNRLQHIVGDDVTCFLAPKSIEAGENWPAQVESHLNRAACVVLLLSETALDSTWVLFEAGVGRGRGIDVIPVALAGFSINGKKPPLSFLQAITVATVDDLNAVLRRVAKALGRTFVKTFVARDLAAIVDREVRPSGNSEVIPLLTRRAVFEEAARLVGSCHINSIIRGVSSLVDTKDSPDRYMNRFDEAVKKRFAVAIREGGRMRYEVVLGIHRDATNAISKEAMIAIKRRARLFREMNALSQLSMRENPDSWSMNLLLVNDSDAILAFPEGSGTRLRCGLKISGSALVAPIGRWYENSLKKHSKLLRPDAYR